MTSPSLLWSNHSVTDFTVYHQKMLYPHGQPIHHRDLFSPFSLWITNKQVELHHLLVLVMCTRSQVCLKLVANVKADQNGWGSKTITLLATTHHYSLIFFFFKYFGCLSKILFSLFWGYIYLQISQDNVHVWETFSILNLKLEIFCIVLNCTTSSNHSELMVPLQSANFLYVVQLSHLCVSC